MTRLGTALTSTDLPRAELCAMRLDGELNSVDEWFSSVDYPDSPILRAAALHLLCEDRFIVEQRSAAWVWGALNAPPQQHELCSSIGARARSSFPQRVRTREVVITEVEWVTLGVVRVTTPLRTAVDYVRFAAPFDTALAERLFVLAQLTIDDCHELIAQRRNLPGKKQALARLQLLDSARVAPPAQLLSKLVASRS